MKVAWLHVAPVKGLGIEAREHIELTTRGVEDDRLFCVVNEEGRILNGKRFAPVTTVRAHFDQSADRLDLALDGERVAGTVRVGEPIEVDVYGHPAAGHLVDGPWTAALSEYFGRVARLVRFDGPGNGHDRARKQAGATLLSRASLARMAEQAGVETPVDPRRFRMLIGVDGATPHEEDGWIGKRVRVGEAVLAPAGNVGRCVTTSLDPETGVLTLDTLDLLAQYRRDLPTTEPLAFGIWARVVHPGSVRLDDEIALLD